MNGRRIFVILLALVMSCATLWAGAQQEAAPATAAPAMEGGPMELHEVWASPADWERETGKKFPAFTEAPELAEMVKQGKLSPVAQRLPKEPVVVLNVDGVGKYGGSFINATYDVGLAVSLRDETRLFLAKYNFGQETYPNLCRSYEPEDAAGTSWIVTLREGTKWSDGQPFTVDDLIFHWDDVVYNDEITPNVPGYFKGQTLEKIDDLTLRLKFEGPTNLEDKQSWAYLATRFPKHYLMQFHPKYTDKAQVEKIAKEAGFETWFDYFNDIADQADRRNTDKPSLEPWVISVPPPAETIVWRRNPYYWVVDPAGQQLPYMNDRRMIITGDQEVEKLKALNGELDWSMLDVDIFTLAKKAEQEGKIKMYVWDNPALVAAQIDFNITHEDPVFRKVFRDIRFKLAVSHALNREMMSELVWQGLSVGRQVAPDQSDPFYHERLANLALEYDPDEANKLLDEMGLDKKNSAGIRLRSDGKPMEIVAISFKTGNLDKMAEIIEDNLKAVGIDFSVRFADWGLLASTWQSNQHDAAFIWESWGSNMGTLHMNAPHYVPTYGLCMWAYPWFEWYSSDGAKGQKPDIPEVLEAIELYDKLRATIDLKEQQQYMKRIMDIAADNLWSIGTVTHPGFLAIVSPELRGVPKGSTAVWRGDFGRRDAHWKDE